MDSLRVSFLPASGNAVEDREIELLGKVELSSLRSVRSPGASREQKHIPGFFWMAKVKEHVWYESRLEMRILKTIDHEQEIRAAIPQPFVILFRSDGKKRTHVPDFLFPLKQGRALLVNVKPQRYVKYARNQVNFTACEAVAERLGWAYATRTEPPPEYEENITWMNGYRRPPWLLEKFRAELLTRASEGPTITQILVGLDPEAFARPVLFHLLWNRQIRFDSSVLLSDETKLWLGEV